MAGNNGGLTKLKKVALIVTIIVAIISITINISSYVKASTDETNALKFFDKIKGEKLVVEVADLKFDIEKHFLEQSKVHANINKTLKQLEINQGIILDNLK